GARALVVICIIIVQLYITFSIKSRTPHKVYNLTNFIALHPGGSSAIIPLCGANGSSAFSNQHSGNNSANNTLANYYIGDLADSSAPTIPTNLSVTPVSASQINLSWSNSSDNIAVTGYAIFRDGNQIATTGNTTFNNTGLNSSTTYNYLVKAYDAAGNRSASSTAVSATTFATSNDTTVPATPTSLSASVISATQINLSWSTSTDNVAVTGYTIFRNGIEIASVTTNNFNNVGLSASTTYNYSVKAYDAAGNRSANSNTTSATTLAGPSNGDTIAPSAPTKLKANVSSYQHVNLKWKKSKDNVKVKGYAIFMNGVQVATVKKDHYKASNLTPNTNYTFTVKAYDAAGNMSSDSNSITVTTKIKKVKEIKQECNDDDDDDDRHEKVSKINELKNKINTQLSNMKVDEKKDKKSNKK
nr:fibronectin type III domain-containing protein [Gammaproteobacteria bacterium]